MNKNMKKIVNDVVASLKKLPSPEKKGDSFWNYLKAQLYSESTWDQEDLKVIETEIGKHLSKMDKKELTEFWKDTEVGWDKFESDKKVDDKEMKADLTSEILGQVMDRMDDNYSGGSFYTPTESYVAAEDENPSKKGEEDDGDSFDDADPDAIKDVDVDIDDTDLFSEEPFDDDDDSRF